MPVFRTSSNALIASYPYSTRRQRLYSSSLRVAHERETTRAISGMMHTRTLYRYIEGQVVLYGYQTDTNNANSRVNNFDGTVRITIDRQDVAGLSQVGGTIALSCLCTLTGQEAGTDGRLTLTLDIQSDPLPDSIV